MSRSSARPDDLAAYHTVTQAMGESLARHCGALTTALDEFRGSTGSILLRDGRTYLRVGTLDRSGSIVYEAPILLTQQQAENLVIRTGGQNDLVELPVNSTLHFTVWSGDDDDMVGSPGSSGAVRTGPGAPGDDHPAVFTENALRDDLGLKRRPSYTFSPSEIERAGTGAGKPGRVVFEDTE